MTLIVGISSYYHDSAACLLENGSLVAAAQEERFSRQKFDKNFPLNAIQYCLREIGACVTDLDAVAYYEDPWLKTERQLWHRLLSNPSHAVTKDLDPTRFTNDLRNRLGYNGPVHFIPHHESHAASSYFFSGYPEAAILVVDGVGEWDTTSWWTGSVKSGLRKLGNVKFPHSLGLFYSIITDFLGFTSNSDEYKVMGLAAYGEPVYLDAMRELLQINGNSFQLNLEHLDFLSSPHAYSAKLSKFLQMPPRIRGEKVTAQHANLARSTQARLEEVLLHLANGVHATTGLDALCLAGGVALNCVANRRLAERGAFKSIFVQPVAGDAGAALGAAAQTHWQLTNTHQEKELKDVYFGPQFKSEDIVSLLQHAQISFQDYRGHDGALLREVARRLAAGQVVAWFQGRMEFGPRALGARSILADPRDPQMKDRLNEKVKWREMFRPFAPSVTSERAAEFFVIDRASRFMIDTFEVRAASVLPAVTHIDGSARVHTVEMTIHPRFAMLLNEFGLLTGVPVLLNTSYNLADEPIVCTPLDALRTFCRTSIDVLCIEDMLVFSTDVPPSLRLSAQSQAARLQVESQPQSRDVYTFF